MQCSGVQVASAEMGTATDASRPCSEYHKSSSPEAFRHPCLTLVGKGRGVTFILDFVF